MTMEKGEMNATNVDKSTSGTAQQAVLRISGADALASIDRVSNEIFKVILDDWMFGFGTLYQENDYQSLRAKVRECVSASKKITFMVPGFPAKSPNLAKKVMGIRADLTEFLALRVIQKTCRKIQALHEPGLEFIVMSDYHTFDQYLGIDEQDYFAYHASLKTLIEEAGCADLIRVISLSDFPEFAGVPTHKISKKLFDDYGGQRATDSFDERLKMEPKFQESYTQMTKFMTHDQEQICTGSPVSSPQRSPQLPRKCDNTNSLPNQQASAIQEAVVHNLLTLLTTSSSNDSQSSRSRSPSPSPSSSAGASPRSKANRRHVRTVVRGMMVQGQCLDVFLKLQTKLTDYIRLSIHHHPPKSGKFSIDLFKGHNALQGVLRTAWHHSIVFDAKASTFTVAHRQDIENQDVPGSCLISVTYKGQDWFFLRLYFEEDFVATNSTSALIEASMIRGSCGIVLRVNQGLEYQQLSAHAIAVDSLTSLIKEFGVVVLRGFEGFRYPDELLKFYAKRSPTGFVEWGFGALKSVEPDEDVPGIVNSSLYLPFHFDLSIPPKYLGVDQKVHRYEDFIPREFVLYCKTSPPVAQGKSNGATTFVDCKGLVLSLHGEKIKEWKQTIVSYETGMRHSTGDKNLYFGGRGAVYGYPLVLTCPWTGHDVLRWNETILGELADASDQELWMRIDAAPKRHELSPKGLEEEIRKLALADNVYFEHVYESGDQVYVNNYTTLHGRNGFAGKRELWRIQALPVSDRVAQELGRKKTTS